MKKFLILMAALMLVVGVVGYASAFDTTNPDGNYYGYADFGSNDGFLGGQSVGGYGNQLFVTRNDSSQGTGYIDIYTVSCSDMTKVDQHPGNPDATGPVVPRTLTLDSSFNVGFSFYDPSATEISVYNDQIHFMEGNTLYTYNMNGTQLSAVTTTANTNGNYMYYGDSHMSMLGYDNVHDTLYGMNEGHRTVYRLDGTVWNHAFSFDSLSGGHPDGLEFVTDTDGTGYLYVSDMTSDYIGQAALQSDGSFDETNLFAYDSTGGDVEGMGFGPLGHFWITDWDSVYEVGGGALGGYIPPTPGGNPVPEPSTILLMGIGILGMAGYSRKKKSRTN